MCSFLLAGTTVAILIVVQPIVQVKPVKPNALISYGKFDDMWADFPIKSVLVHPQVSRGVPESNHPW